MLSCASSIVLTENAASDDGDAAAVDDVAAATDDVAAAVDNSVEDEDAVLFIFF